MHRAPPVHHTLRSAAVAPSRGRWGRRRPPPAAGARCPPSPCARRATAAGATSARDAEGGSSPVGRQGDNAKGVVLQRVARGGKGAAAETTCAWQGSAWCCSQWGARLDPRCLATAVDHPVMQATHSLTLRRRCATNASSAWRSAAAWGPQRESAATTRASASKAGTGAPGRKRMAGSTAQLSARCTAQPAMYSATSSSCTRDACGSRVKTLAEGALTQRLAPTARPARLAHSRCSRCPGTP